MKYTINRDKPAPPPPVKTITLEVTPNELAIIASSVGVTTGDKRRTVTSYPILKILTDAHRDLDLFISLRTACEECK